MGSGIGPMPMHDVVVMAVRGEAPSPFPPSRVRDSLSFVGPEPHLVAPLKTPVAPSRGAEAACSCNCGQECCERGYYYLHQRLYDFTLVHSF